MDRNDRFMIDENGEVLTPKIGTWMNEDGELYDLVRCEHWNSLTSNNVEIVEIWVYDCLQFLGYIIKPIEKSTTDCMKEFLQLYHEQNWNERGRGVNQLPVILHKEK